MKSNFPNFLIVGAAKSGTTTLYQLLKDHPEIYMPDRKELNFWYTSGRDDWAILKRFPDLPKNLEDYLAYFPENKKAMGEASPGYLTYYNEVIENLKNFHPNYKQVKIIIILREPISKIWSHFKMVDRGNMDPDGLSLKDSLIKESVRMSEKKYLLDVLPLFSTDYLPQVKGYKDNFENVKVVLFDDLSEKPQMVLDEICEFLEVSQYQSANLGVRYNSAPNGVTFPKNRIIDTIRKIGLNKLIPERIKNIRRRKYNKEVVMDEQVKKILIKRFKDDIPKLQELIGKDLSSWMDKYK